MTEKSTQHIALLRGINVGGNNKIAMPELKIMFEKLGYYNVQTYINSGNIIFDVSDKEEKVIHTIEQGINKTFNLQIPVIVRSADNLHKVLKNCDSTWQNTKDEKTNIMFLWPEVDDKKVLDQFDITNKDTVRYIDGAIVWNTHTADFNQSGLANLAKNPLYKKMTIRNINTLRKLVAITKGE